MKKEQIHNLMYGELGYEKSIEFDILSSQRFINCYRGRHGKVKVVLEEEKFVDIGDVEFIIGHFTFDGVKYLTIDFEGSHGDLDWWRNIQFKKVSLGRGIKVHLGFCLQATAVLSRIAEEILAYPKQDKIVFGGHSQGAAIPSLIVYLLNPLSLKGQYKVSPELEKKLWKIKEMYKLPILSTDAEPRVGNKKFVNYLMSMVSQSRTYINGADTVVKVPFALPTVKFLWTMSKNPYWMNYRSKPTIIKIGQKLSWKEKLLFIPRKIFGNPFDHKPQRYLKNKKKKLKEIKTKKEKNES